MDGDSEGWWGSRVSTALSKTFPAKTGVVLAAGAKLAARQGTTSNKQLVTQLIELLSSAHDIESRLKSSILRIATGSNFQHAS